MIFSVLIKIIFIVALIFDLSFNLSYISPIFIFWNSWANIYLIGGLISVILVYIFIFISSIINAFNFHNKLVNKINKLYTENRMLILTSTIFTSSTLIPLLTQMFYPNIFSYEMRSLFPFPMILLFIKLLLILSMFLIVKIAPKIRFIKILSIAFSSLMLSMLLFMTIGIISEFIPNYYFTFPLDDKNATYIINYDGDYWLTYYKTEYNCNISTTKGENCSRVLVKKGNTSITQSPVELESFIGKPVIIKGDFVRINGPLQENKKICIGEGFKKECQISKGPGTWHASPLKIHSINEI